MELAVRTILHGGGGITTLRALRSVHAAMLVSSNTDHVSLTTSLVSHYAQLGYMPDAHAVFSEAPRPDVFLWNALIRGWAENGSHQKAISLYAQMRNNKGDVVVLPDKFTFPVVVKCCAQLLDLEQGKKVHLDAVDLGYQSDIFVANSLISMYGKCGSLEMSRQVFDGMLRRNVVTWSTIIGAYAQHGRHGEALRLFREMFWDHVRPNRATFLNVMPCVVRSSQAEEMYGLVVINGLDTDLRIQNAAIGMFAKCRRIEFALRLFNRMPDKDLISWSSMIEAYVQAELPMNALDLFKKMKVQKITPDYVTVLGVISACSTASSLRRACFLHGYAVKSLFEHNVVLQTALVDLYVKCGSLKFARRLFDRMQDRNLISWSTMISGYGMHGQGRDALDLFHQMKSDVKPDKIIFVAVLSACSHSGLIDEGWQCFNSMNREFGIAPRAEHYACMVDLMGRAGQLNKALDFINDMPITPDSGVWGSLLGACRIHLNVEIAEVAAKSLFELDPENSGRYILLSNIYTFSGMRDEADCIRTLMKRRGVKKSTGQSMIEVRNKVYKFIVGDRSNPQSERIYEELDRLMHRIKKEGYVPNTNLVLLDVEEEAKENLLYVHSEKLAIVFGLLNLGPESDILIHKNLRFCGDCHTATKFISKVTARKIVVRDSRRFHHFKNGECSCRDYW